MILSIDPSFSGFGIAVVSDTGDIIYTTKLTHSVKDFRHSYIGVQKAAFDIIEKFNKEIESLDNIQWFDNTIVEYPAYQTRSGSELMCLNGMLSQVLSNPKFGDVYWIPPVACDSFIGNKDHHKSFIVNWAKREYKIPLYKRISHDECTCLVFIKILQSILRGEYKNTYFKSKFVSLN